jgi:hypothetical protein
VVISTSSPQKKKWKFVKTLFEPLKIITLVLPALTIIYQRSQNLDRASNYLYKPSMIEAKRIKSFTKRRMEIKI